MSGDYPPEILIEGAAQAVEEVVDTNLVLVGDAPRIEKKLKSLKFNSARIEIFHAGSVIGMDEDPVTGVRKKKDASVVLAAQLSQQGKVDGYFSPGNTGATLTAALMINKRLKGISRPALSVILPTLNKAPCVLLDIGANPECNVLNFLQFAVIGEVLIREIFKIPKPTIGLLNIGEEETKGTTYLQKIHKLFKTMGFNFVGNVESKLILEGKVNVIIADGFTGNIVLKTIEGTYRALMKMIKMEVGKNIIYQAGAVMMKQALNNIKKRVSSEEYGASPLLGVDAVAMVGHGSSRQRDIVGGVKMTRNFIQYKINDKIVEGLRIHEVGRLHYPFWAKLIGEAINAINQ
jgi:glycerol-3-phosphate acyltransferase PlsX